MPKRDYIDFQERTEPLAFLITFRTYGTWLHGGLKGSIDRKNYNRYGTPGMPANEKVLAEERAALKTEPLFLNTRQSRAVESAIKEVV
jgi:hypothetical protein